MKATFRVLPGLPPYGASAISFPASFARSGREGLVVEFLPDTPDAWVGNFRPGVGGYTGVHDHPNGRDVLVFATGAAFAIDPMNRAAVAELPGSGFINGVHAVANPPGLVCDIQGTAFFRLGADGIVWHTRRLSLDGFRDVTWTASRIRGEGLEIDATTWTPFEVDLRTGEAKGGPYVPLP